MIDESRLLRVLGERPVSEPVYWPALDPISPGRRVRGGRGALASRSSTNEVMLLLSVLVTIALVLVLVVGGVLLGGRDRDRGVIAFVSADYSWDGTLTARDVGLYAIAPSGADRRLLLPRGTVGRPSRLDPVMIGPAARWSPNGTHIAFRADGGQPGIAVIDRDGGNLRVIGDATPAPRVDTFAWSPDGTRIAFISAIASGWPPNANNSKLYVADVMNGTVEVLSDEASGSVAWSPDGSTIAFGRSRPRTSLLVLVDADGTGERTFRFDHQGQNTLGGIAWSPDGSRIAFEQTRFTGAEEGNFLMAVGLNGVEPREVASWPMEGCCAFGSVGGLLEWSPDGSRIAVQRHADVLVTAADGSGAEVSIEGTSFDWSPDGSQLVITALGERIEGSPLRITQLGGDIEESSYRAPVVYLADADGSERTRLTDGAYPQWSP